MKKVSRFIYSWFSPIFNPIQAIRAIIGYSRFIKDLFNYKKSDKSFKLLNANYLPQVLDKTSTTGIDYHYFYQQIWCFDNIKTNNPQQHIDVGSRYEMIGYISTITKAIFIDIRPIEVDLPNLENKKGSILQMPYETDSVESLSCLHVIEHIGLGRYGDPIDAEGSIKACKELKRVLKPGGKLYISVPIGKERVCFNAHRIFHPSTIIEYFDGLKLLEFNAINDEGKFIRNCDYKEFNHLDYGLGMFIFTK